MKITAFKQQVKNPERVSIFVDSEYSFSLSLDEVLKHKVSNGQEVTAADVKKFKKISADGKLRARTLEWLLNRPHSERELRDYLYRKKAEPEQIQNLVDEFTEKAYLDNVKFAVWFSELQARRNKSDRQIRAELFKKGISREIVEDILNESGPSTVLGVKEGEEDRLKALIAKKSKLPRYQADPQKLKQYLARQGFGYDQINEVLKNT